MVHHGHDMPCTQAVSEFYGKIEQDLVATWGCDLKVCRMLCHTVRADLDDMPSV